MHAYVYKCVYLYVCRYVHVYGMCMCICMCACMYAGVYVQVYLYMYTHIYMYACVHICMHVCMHAWTQARGQHQVFFLRWDLSLPWNRPTRLSRLASAPQRSSCLWLPRVRLHPCTTMLSLSLLGFWDWTQGRVLTQQLPYQMSHLPSPAYVHLYLNLYKHLWLLCFQVVTLEIQGGGKILFKPKEDSVLLPGCSFSKTLMSAQTSTL